MVSDFLPLRPTWIEVDLDIVENNVRIYSELCAPAMLCAVVKADAYGHGLVPVARAALGGGATWLAVATVDEGCALRADGIDCDILMLSEPAPFAMSHVVMQRLTPAVFTKAGIDAYARACEAAESVGRAHLKVDTGMHRAGVLPDEVLEFVAYIDAEPWVEIEGLWTHFAVADEPEHPTNAKQSNSFVSVLSSLGDRAPSIVHACNSAAATLRAEERRSLVRMGIGLYGVAPSVDVPLAPGVRPALSLKSHVSWVRNLDAGERISYGQHYELGSASRIATVPIGYADGVPRLLSLRGAQVLIHGTRLPIAGQVTMDQLMVDCGNLPIEAGDEVVLIGSQGSESVGTGEWAEITETIPYEILTGLGPRVPRRYVRGAQ